MGTGVGAGLGADVGNGVTVGSELMLGAVVGVIVGTVFKWGGRVLIGVGGQRHGGSKAEKYLTFVVIIIVEQSS